MLFRLHKVQLLSGLVGDQIPIHPGHENVNWVPNTESEDKNWDYSAWKIFVLKLLSVVNGRREANTEYIKTLYEMEQLIHNWIYL